MTPTRLFPIIIITLFGLASILCFACGQNAKGAFYFFSAAINVTILYV